MCTRVDDETAPPSHLEFYARAVPQARVHRLPDRDHQLNNDLREVAAAIRSLEAGPERGNQHTIRGSPTI